MAAISLVNCVQGSTQTGNLLGELRALGVVLAIDADGRLAYDAPTGVMGGDLLEHVREHRDELLLAMALEHTDPPAPKFLPSVPGVICPWCRSGERLLDYSRGIQCIGCDRVAFRCDGDSILRADCTL
jgi:hypothetical protein